MCKIWAFIYPNVRNLSESQPTDSGWKGLMQALFGRHLKNPYAL